ncbi:MAG: response regulator transcription factor [Christensenellaceae bacterium]|nr:response regulator transcription factor [Christensenellaceae bacterium]
MAKRILIVDDEPILVKGLRFNLEQQEGYEIDVAYDGLSAMETFDPERHDLILLDLMLPGLDGLEVCQRIRQNSDVPIIMLTAKGDDIDKIMGLETGADDYMTKPFNMLELKARIKTIFRRADAMRSKSSVNMVKVRDMSVDFISRNVTIGGKEVYLTAKEFDLLQLFITHRGTVFGRESLLDIIWKQKGDLRTVDVHIRRLREKIEHNPAHPEFILTKWGVGYYFTGK